MKVRAVGLGRKIVGAFGIEMTVNEWKEFAKSVALVDSSSCSRCSLTSFKKPILRFAKELRVRGLLKDQAKLVINEETKEKRSITHG